MIEVSRNIVFALGGIFGILASSNTILYFLKARLNDSSFRELSLRIRSWWIMAAVFSIAVVLDKSVTIVFLSFVSFLALKEYFSIVPTRRADRRVLFWAYLAIPLQYLWVYLQWYEMFIIFIPVFLFLFIPFRMLLIGEIHSFLHAAGMIHWGVMAFIFSISHVAFLLALPQQGDCAAGGAGLVLFLMFLTQFNDVSQYLWGKTFGKHRIIPKGSPNKTWEGFLGGIATTTLLSLLIAPYLTPMNQLDALISGLIISVGGFLGDVTVSALKRDLGIKDSGSTIPGHGGILDRVDSLTFTAPLFFHFIYYGYF